MDDILKGNYTRINIKLYKPSLFTRFMSHFPAGTQNRVWSIQEYIYWYRWLPCFKCKRITKWLRCDNCNRFFCMRHAERDDAEYGDYGSILDLGGYPICYRCDE